MRKNDEEMKEDDEEKQNRGIKVSESSKSPCKLGASPVIALTLNDDDVITHCSGLMIRRKDKIDQH